MQSWFFFCLWKVLRHRFWKFIFLMMNDWDWSFEKGQKSEFACLFSFSTYHIEIFLGFLFLLDGLVWLLSKNYHFTTSIKNGVRMQKFHSALTYFCRLKRQHGKGRVNLFSSLPFLSTHKHSEICLSFCIWDDYLIINHSAPNWQALDQWDLSTFRN